MDQKVIEALEKKGFSRWTKGTMDRLYINPTCIGLELEYYKTGNVSDAYLNGERISNTRGREMKAAKCYIDIATGDCVSNYDVFVEAMQALLAEAEAELAEEEAPSAAPVPSGETFSQEAPAAPAEQPRNPQIAADFAQMRQLMGEMGYTSDERRRAVEGFVASAPVPAPRTSPRQRGNTSPLAEARMSAGLTQAQLAQKVGCTQKDISRWEHGVYTPSAAYAVSLADALGCTVEQLINA